MSIWTLILTLDFECPNRTSRLDLALPRAIEIMGILGEEISILGFNFACANTGISSVRNDSSARGSLESGM